MTYLDKKQKEFYKLFVEPIDSDLRAMNLNGEKYTIGKADDVWDFISQAITEAYKDGVLMGHFEESKDRMWYIKRAITEAREEERKRIIKIAKELSRKCPYMPRKDKEVYVEMNMFLTLLKEPKGES